MPRADDNWVGATVKSPGDTGSSKRERESLFLIKNIARMKCDEEELGDEAGGNYAQEMPDAAELLDQLILLSRLIVGYGHDYTFTPEGQLLCPSCGKTSEWACFWSTKDGSPVTIEKGEGGDPRCVEFAGHFDGDIGPDEMWACQCGCEYKFY